MRAFHNQLSNHSFTTGQLGISGFLLSQAVLWRTVLHFLSVHSVFIVRQNSRNSAHWPTGPRGGRAAPPASRPPRVCWASDRGRKASLAPSPHCSPARPLSLRTGLLTEHAHAAGVQNVLLASLGKGSCCVSQWPVSGMKSWGSDAAPK